MDSPLSAEKLPLPASKKRSILAALEVECSNLHAMLQRKRQLVAQKALEVARQAPHPGRSSFELAMPNFPCIPFTFVSSLSPFDLAPWYS